MREQGYYRVKKANQWLIAYYVKGCGFVCWQQLIGYLGDQIFMSDDYFEEINETLISAEP